MIDPLEQERVMSDPPEDDYYAETGLIGDLERGVGQKLSDYVSYELGNVEAVPPHVEARIVSGLDALEQRVEGLERIKSAFEYLAIESESGVIETEAAENGDLLSRAEHDKRIARFVRETLAAEEEA